MVTCKICNKQYKRIDSVHLSKSHNITVDEYLKEYPGSDVISKETLQRYADGTKKYAIDNPEKMKSRQKNRKPLSKETKARLSELLRKRNLENRDTLYGPERNKKVAQSTTKRWDSYSSEQKSAITKKSVETTRKRMGEDAYLHMMAEKSMKGYETLTKNGRGSKWQEQMNNRLLKKYPNVIFEKRVGGRFFDAFIPSKNLLVEFDGDFWHPQSLDECQYDFQIQNFHNDRRKDQIAKENGYDLIRIRQSNENEVEGI